MFRIQQRSGSGPLPVGGGSGSQRFWARGGSMVMGWVVSPAEPPQNRPGNANEKMAPGADEKRVKTIKKTF